MNKLEELKKLLKSKKSLVYYAARLGVSVDKIKELKKQIKTPVSEKYNYNNKEKELTFTSNKPLSPKELEKLANVDNITTFLERHWLKSKVSGIWTYTVQVGTKIKNFYSKDELTERLKEIFKETKEFKKPKQNIKSKELLTVVIADDHVGLKLENSQYGNDYSSTIYSKRLSTVIDEIRNLDRKFDVICVLRMGDELDGWNAKTTRYDHDLDSLSNKEQFDIYTIANKIFYNELFKSDLANTFQVINLENSNHSGKGYSYMANKALEFWIQARFPFVKWDYQSKFLETYEFGNHVIGLTHGKDEKYMKSPMPIDLDTKTDLYLMEYFRRFDSKKFFHLIKGDMHKFATKVGKFGRYVNIPSISSGSKWIELNYGDSVPGALLEIYRENKRSVISIPIYFDENI